MIDLEFDVTLTQGEFTIEVRDSSRVEVLGLFGPSGAGKTTLLEAIAGLRRPALGRIRVGDRTLFESAAAIDLPPRERRIGYVAQDVLLFPHLDVRRNVLYGARKHHTMEPLLDIPDDISIAATVALGWPVKAFPKRLRRRPLDEIAFGERYGQPLPGRSTNL